jgi:hypothetical protein
LEDLCSEAGFSASKLPRPSFSFVGEVEDGKSIGGGDFASASENCSWGAWVGFEVGESSFEASGRRAI